MKEVGKRLKVLGGSWPFAGENGRDNRLGSTQSSVNRYENGQSTSPVALFRVISRYFSTVSSVRTRSTGYSPFSFELGWAISYERYGAISA